MANRGSTTSFLQTRDGREGWGSARRGQVEEKQGERLGRMEKGNGGGLVSAMAWGWQARPVVGQCNRGARARGVRFVLGWPKMNRTVFHLFEKNSNDLN
jgi:hypothetical protein